MNRLDQLTSELRSKLQADWFTETDQSKPVTMGVTSSDLDGQARLPVRGLQWPHCSGGLRRRYWRARPHEGLSQFEGLMVLVLTITQWDSLRSCSLLERRLPPPHIAVRGPRTVVRSGLNPPETKSPEVITPKI